MTPAIDLLRQLGIEHEVAQYDHDPNHPSFGQEAADALGVELVIERGSDPTFHPGRCAQLTIDNTIIGHAGELHPGVNEACAECVMEPDALAAMMKDMVVTLDPSIANGQ